MFLFLSATFRSSWVWLSQRQLLSAFSPGTSCAEVSNLLLQFQLRITIAGKIWKIIDELGWFLFTNIFFSFAHGLLLRLYFFSLTSYCCSHPPTENSFCLEKNLLALPDLADKLPSWFQDLFRPCFSLLLLLTLPSLPFPTVWAFPGNIMTLHTVFLSTAAPLPRPIASGRHF